MKITVITDASGKVVGTMAHAQNSGGGTGESAGAPVTHLVAGPGQTVHELDLPNHLVEIGSAEKFHSLIAEHLAKQSKESGKPGA